MVKQLLLPGHVERIAGFTWFRPALARLYGELGSNVALSRRSSASTPGLVYLTLSPAVLSLTAGSAGPAPSPSARSLMAAAIFSWPSTSLFLIALLCLWLASGASRVISPARSAPSTRRRNLRRADAFQIYYLSSMAPSLPPR